MRNAVYAADLVGTLLHFTSVQRAGSKRYSLEQNKVNIDHLKGELQTLDFKVKEFDTIALIYAHFPAEIKSECHRLLNRYLRQDGIIVFGTFCKKHPKYSHKNGKFGSPADLADVFSIEESLYDLRDYAVSTLDDTEADLNAGMQYSDAGSVNRFIVSNL